MQKESKNIDPLKHIHPSNSDEMAKQRTAPDPNIALNLSRLMELVGLKQSALAAKSGVGQSTISRILNGDDSPTSRTLSKLAGALGVSVNTFFDPPTSASPPFHGHPKSDSLVREPAVKMPGLRNVPVVGVAKLINNSSFELARGDVNTSQGHVPVSTDDQTAYAVRVRGDALHPAVRDGWLIVAEPAKALTAGEFVIVGMKDGSTQIHELLYERADSVAVISIDGQVRLSLQRADIEYIHAVGAIYPPSRLKY